MFRNTENASPLEMFWSITLNRIVFHFKPIRINSPQVINACILIRTPYSEVVEVSWVHDNRIQPDYSRPTWLASACSKLMTSEELCTFLLPQVKMSNNTIFSTAVKNARAARFNCHLVSTVPMFCKVLCANPSVFKNGPISHLKTTARTHVIG